MNGARIDGEADRPVEMKIENEEAASRGGSIGANIFFRIYDQTRPDPELGGE